MPELPVSKLKSPALLGRAGSAQPIPSRRGPLRPAASAYPAYKRCGSAYVSTLSTPKSLDTLVSTKYCRNWPMNEPIKRDPGFWPALVAELLNDCRERHTDNIDEVRFAPPPFSLRRAMRQRLGDL